MITETDLIQQIDHRLNPDKWKYVVTLAIVNMFWYQTQDEKATKSTVYKNNVGFNSVDAHNGSRWAIAAQPNGIGSPVTLIPDNEINKARDMVMRYRKQITNILNSIATTRKAKAASSSTPTETSKEISKLDDQNTDTIKSTQAKSEPSKKAPTSGNPLGNVKRDDYIKMAKSRFDTEKSELLKQWE